MGRWLYIFQSLAETPIHNAVKGIANPDPKSLAPHKENRTTRGFKSNRLNALHPLFLRHQTRRKYVQRRAKPLQLQRLQPAVQKNAAARPLNLGGVVSVVVRENQKKHPFSPVLSLCEPSSCPRSGSAWLSCIAKEAMLSS